MGTPDEIAKLINAGYIGVLKILSGAMIAVDGDSGKPIGVKKIWMLQIDINDNGCVMRRNGKCLLQESGLTPEMGKRHLRGDGDSSKEMYPRVIGAWNDRAHGKTIIYCLESFMKLNDEKNNHTN
jgi:hypothetical protein